MPSTAPIAITAVLDTAPIAVLRSLRALRGLRSALPHLIAFAGVGGLAFVVDVGVFNLLRATILADHVVWAKVASVAIATAVAWLGHRLVTFRSNRPQAGLAREIALFAVVNVGGLLIAAAVLYISHNILGFTSVVADNVAGNVIGLVLATVFRYLAYRFVVFRHPGEVVPHGPVLDPDPQPVT